MDNVSVSGDHSVFKPRLSERNDTGNIIVPPEVINGACVIDFEAPFTLSMVLPLVHSAEMVFSVILSLL